MRTVTTDLGVAACLVENNKILLVKEAKGPQKYHWGLPKGTVDEEELPQIAVIRELKEECGIDGIVQGLVGMRECMIKQTPAIFLAYYVSTENSIVRIDNDEIDDFGWFEEKDFEDLEWISSAMKEIAKKSLNDYNGKLIDYSIERGRSYFLYL